MADSVCSSCGKALAQADVLYNDRAEIVCSECTAKADIVGDERRSARGVKIAAWSCAGAAIAGFAAFGIGFGLAFWPLAIAAVASGLFAVNGIAGSGSERFAKYLTSGDKTQIWIACAIGFAITAFELLALGGVIHFRLWIV